TRHSYGYHNSDHPHRKPESLTGRFCNSIYLRKSSASQHSCHDPEKRKQLCKPSPPVTKTILNIIHRSSADLPVFICSSVLYRKNAFCIFSCHSQKGRHPHPKQRTGTSRPECCSNPYNTACSNGCRKCCAKRSKC